MISKELKSAAKIAIGEESGYGAHRTAKVIRDLLEAIDAHECEASVDRVLEKLGPCVYPSGGVPDELRERVNGYTDMDKMSALSSVEVIADFNELLAIADAKPGSGWVEGPPKEPGDYRYTRGGVMESREFTKEELSWDWVQRIEQHHRLLPPPPKREPVVDCCEFGRKCIIYNEIAHRWLVLNDDTESWFATHCICGTPLPELEK